MLRTPVQTRGDFAAQKKLAALTDSGDRRIDLRLDALALCSEIERRNSEGKIGRALCDDGGLVVIEDAAQARAVKYRGVR